MTDASTPARATFFRLLAVLSGLGGTTLVFLTWPDYPGYGQELSQNAYIYPLTLLSSSIIQALLFWSVADLLERVERMECRESVSLARAASAASPPPPDPHAGPQVRCNRCRQYVAESQAKVFLGKRWCEGCFIEAIG